MKSGPGAVPVGDRASHRRRANKVFGKRTRELHEHVLATFEKRSEALSYETLVELAFVKALLNKKRLLNAMDFQPGRLPQEENTSNLYTVLITWSD